MVLCACGCGKETRIADRNQFSRGQIKGHPLKYIHGHNFTLQVAIDGKKRCTKCGQIKSTDLFMRDKRLRSGIGFQCRNCRNLKSSKYSRENREKINTKKRIWKERNRAKLAGYWKTHHQKRHNTKQAKINVSMAHGIWSSLRGGKNNRHWQTLVDFTLDQLVNHIEKRFTTGMSWDRFMKGEIHIDHIIPKAAFNFETAEDIDFKKCWALKNLQPLWASENCRKRDRLKKPFQPSLNINCGRRVIRDDQDLMEREDNVGL